MKSGLGISARTVSVRETGSMRVPTAWTLPLEDLARTCGEACRGRGMPFFMEEATASGRP